MTTAEGEYSKAKTSVWWDIENCEVPKGWDAHAIAQNVSSALLKMNYGGPVSISAYGDTNLIPHAVQQALSSTGVGLNHVPADDDLSFVGVKDASDKKILVDMLLWAVDNPAPANFMLISGDRDFSNALHQLSMRRYNILLAQPPRASAPLVAAAKNVWLWTSLASGGPPLTSAESAALVNNGRCLLSNYEAAKGPVYEQTQSSKPTDSTSDARDSKDKKPRDNHVPRGGLPQETKRNMLQNGRRATGEPVASCGSFEAHHSDIRHTSQAAFVASHKAQANVSAKPIHEASFVPSNKAQANVSAKPMHEAPFVASHKAQPSVSARPIHDTPFVASHKAQPNASARPIHDASFVGSHTHKAQPNFSAKPMHDASFVGSHTHKAQPDVSARPIHDAPFVASHTHKAQANVSAKPIHEAAPVASHKAQANVSAKPIHEAAPVASHKAQTNVSAKPILNAPFVASQKSQATVSSKPTIQEAALVEPVLCNVCQISCANKDAYVSHTYGKRHRKNLELQTGKSENLSRGLLGLPTEVLGKQKNRKNASEGRTKPNGHFPCRLCNVVCQSQVVFESHLKGQKHATMLSQSEAFTDSKKLQEKGVWEKVQPREAVAEPKTNADYACGLCNVTCQSQTVFDSHLRGQKHAAMLSQSEALVDSKKLQEKDVGEMDQPREEIVEPQLQSQNAQENSKCFEKHVAMALVDSRKLEEKVVQENVQPIETIAEPQSQSQNTQETNKFFEKPNVEFREVHGTSKSCVKEKDSSTKDWVETVFFGDFGASEEARECFDGIVKPVNLSEGATEKEKDVMVPRTIASSNKICDSQGLSTVPAFVASDDIKSSVSTKPITKEPEVLQPVWCQVCQMSCSSKVAYANHTYGKKHRQALELQSAKNENMSKGPAKLSKENAESKTLTAFDFQNHGAMFYKAYRSLHRLLLQKAFVDSRRTRQELRQIVMEHSFGKAEATEEQTLVKTEDHGCQEEVKEINAISENLTRALTGTSQESSIPKESRGCLDVIPERVQLPAEENVTKKFEDESKHKPQPTSQDPLKESAGLKEHPGEAAKKEEAKVEYAFDKSDSQTSLIKSCKVSVSMCFDSITHTAEAEYATAKTSVWWDIENCPVPKGWDAHSIAQKLNTALVNLNYRGPLSIISAYGNTDLIPKPVQQALSSTGISLNHVPSGKKDASDKKILVDMFLWVLENPAPANLMLISGDGDFSYALNRLRMLRYNILLAHPLQASSPSLVGSARTSWMWTSLLANGRPSPRSCCCSFASEISSREDVSVPVSVSEHVLSTQAVDSGSVSSKAARKKLRKLNQQLQKKCSETGESEWFCRLCNSACKSIEILTTGKEHAAQALVDSKNIEECVQDSDLQSGDAQESIKCLEKQNKELMRTITTSERSGREFWQDFKERLDKNGVAPPLDVNHFCSELSRDFHVPKEVRECFEAIFKILEPTQNDIEIEKLETMLKQGLEIESGEPENDAPAEPSENHEGDMTKKKNTVIEDKYEPYVCSVCNVVCAHPSVFESHHKGRKHAAKSKKHLDALLDNHHLQEKIIQDNSLPKDMTRIEDKAEPCVCSICNVICDHPAVFESHHKGRKHAAKFKKHIEALLDNHQKQEEIIQDNDLPKDMKMIEDKAEPYVCRICNVVCAHPSVFESHLKGRKHAAKIKKHTEALLDDQQIQEEIIQDNGLPKDMKEELQIMLVEAPENIDYLHKQSQELRESCATSERSVEDSFQTIEEVREIDYKSLPNAECFFTELNPEISAPQEASECINAVFKKPEVSQDANLSREVESVPNENLEINSGDPESSSAGATEHPKEYMKKVKATKENDVPKPYVCSICNVSCVCPIVFESHLRGRKHAARVKKHAEVLFDDKKVLEQSLEEKNRPRDALEELQIEPKEAQVSIKEVSQTTKEGVDNENKQIPSVEFPEPKEASSRERFDSIVKRLELFMEKTSKQTLVEAENASERVGEVTGTGKENGVAVAQIRVCDWCNVFFNTQMDLDSHLAGKRHAARTQMRVCDCCSVICHSQMDFDLHLGGKRHAATLKKQVPLLKKEVAVV
ncbi:hypothetical protein Bca101_014472 [Brassica carinata]